MNLSSEKGKSVEGHESKEKKEARPRFGRVTARTLAEEIPKERKSLPADPKNLHDGEVPTLIYVRTDGEEDVGHKSKEGSSCQSPSERRTRKRPHRKEEVLDEEGKERDNQSPAVRMGFYVQHRREE